MTLVSVILAFAAGHYAAQAARVALVAAARTNLALHVAAFKADLQTQGALPLALAADPEIAAVAAGADPDTVRRVDRRLNEIAAVTGAAVIYVIRADGVTIAASNAGEAGSFVGQNYGFRPYFTEALSRGAGSQFALGTVSGRPGFYRSRRIGEGAGAGVLVVKTEFDTVEAGWRSGPAQVFIADPRGIVLVSSDPGWRFQALGRVPQIEKQRIREALEFGGAPLDPLPLAPVAGSPDLWRVARGESPARLMVHVDAAVPDTGWRLHTLTPVSGIIERERWQAQAIAALLAGAGGLGAAIIIGRRRRIAARLAEGSARRDQLEAEVAARTRALTDANRALRTEMQERRQAEEERQRLGRELAQAGRLAAMGQFAASMAHEINQPLAAIRSYADNAATLIARGCGEEAVETVNAVGRLVDRIGGLTRQLKGFARRASGRRTPVDLPDVLAHARELVEARAQAAGAILDIAVPGTVPKVLGEGPRLEQVFVNLLQNAVDAAGSSPGPRVRVTIEADDEVVAVTVCDNGPGIAPGARAQVFDPFFTTKADGLGLGLSISRGIVEDCGGTLAVVDAPEGGAAFRVALMRADASGKDT